MLARFDILSSLTLPLVAGRELVLAKQRPEGSLSTQGICRPIQSTKVHPVELQL